MEKIFERTEQDLHLSAERKAEIEANNIAAAAWYAREEEKKKLLAIAGNAPIAK
jgi:hypothetical protein